MTVQTPVGVGNRPVVTIKLASTSDELMQCYMLRAAVFMGEQACPYGEEFDGNDYTASHVIMYVDGEPAGSMRLRWFQSFCKFERGNITKGSGKYSSKESGSASINTRCLASRPSFMVCTIVDAAEVRWACVPACATKRKPRSSP